MSDSKAKRARRRARKEADEARRRLSGGIVVEQITDTDELAYYSLLRHQFEQVAEIEARLNNVGPTFPRRGSALAADDAASNPYHVSLLVRHYFSVCLDQFRLLGLPLIREQTLHPFALYPLIRSALECAAHSAWIMAAPDRETRITRRLNLLWSEAGNRDKFFELSPSLDPKGDRSTRQRASVKDLASRNKIEQTAACKGVTMTSLIKEVERVVPMTTKLSIEAAWQVTAGASHGQQWAIFTLSDREVQDSGHDPDVKHAKFTAGIKVIFWSVSCALGVLEWAVDEYVRRGSDPDDEPASP